LHKEHKHYGGENMETLFLNWKNVGTDSEEEVLRYCHNCGKKVIFKDSLVRRENANGKNIYRWAIYKCEKGHTWNRKLKNLKAFNNMEDNIAPDTPSKLYTTLYDDKVNQVEKYINEGLTIVDIKSDNYESIEILIDEVEGKTRVDSLLSTKFQDLSRNKIKKLIEMGKILINECTIKSNKFIKSSCRITILDVQKI